MLGREGRRLFDGTPEGRGCRGGAPSSLLATCGRCGDVVVDVVGTVIHRGPDPAVCRFAFICPSCRRPLETTAPSHLATVLLCLGAVEAPGIEELRERRARSPLTTDDLLDLMLALERRDVPTP